MLLSRTANINACACPIKHAHARWWHTHAAYVFCAIEQAAHWITIVAPFEHAYGHFTEEYESVSLSWKASQSLSSCLSRRVYEHSFPGVSYTSLLVSTSTRVDQT